MLNEARSDLMKQESQVESLNSCINELSNKLVLKDWNYRTQNTDFLNLDDNKFVYRNNYR